MHRVDLGESFQTHIYSQNLASVQPRTSPLKFARSSNAAAERARADGARDGKARHTARGRARHQAMATDLPIHNSEPFRIFSGRMYYFNSRKSARRNDSLVFIHQGGKLQFPFEVGMAKCLSIR